MEKVEKKDRPRVPEGYFKHKLVGFFAKEHSYNIAVVAVDGWLYEIIKYTTKSHTIVESCLVTLNDLDMFAERWRLDGYVGLLRKSMATHKGG